MTRTITLKKPELPLLKLCLAFSLYEDINPYGYGEDYLYEQQKAFNDLLKFLQDQNHE